MKLETSDETAQHHVELCNQSRALQTNVMQKPVLAALVGVRYQRPLLKSFFLYHFRHL